jgi:TonB family protein
MFPQSMPMSELRPDDSTPELAHTLEQHLVAGFPPDLALDLVLNELVSRAAQATRAGGAALALTRGNNMVCRAATGQLAPGLGVTLNSSDGLSGACLQTREPQHSLDTEDDSRVDQTASRLLGIRSILIVPVFRVREENVRRGDRIASSRGHNNKDAELMGILEVFSAAPGAFSESDQRLLQDFAEECARIRLVATELTWHKPAADSASDSDSNDYLPPPLPYSKSAISDRVVRSEESELAGSVSAPIAREMLAPENPGPETLNPDLTTSAIASPIAEGSSEITPTPIRRASSGRSRYEGWSLVLGGLAIALAIAVSFLIGSRIGWLRHSTLRAASIQPTSAPNTNPCLPGDAACQSEQTGSGRLQGRPPSEKISQTKAGGTMEKPRDKDKAKSAAAPGELVVYEKGKVVFRMKPAPVKDEEGAADQDKSKPVDSALTNDANGQSAKGIVAASSTTRMASFQSAWLAPVEAESRLLTRVEPKFPAEALNAHRSGAVILEVQVAEDGSVSNIRTLSGDPLLANAATDAVRQWRYQPYRQHNRPSQFQTHVTLNFTLPN